MIRKRQQIDSFRELPKEKRPPEWMLWWGYPEEVENWLDKVFSGKQSPIADIVISEDEIEG